MELAAAPDHSDRALGDLLRTSRTIAVLGASEKQHRAGYFVPDYLATQGYRLLPVNPTYQGRQLFGHAVVPDLAALDPADLPVDIVLVFRRGQALPQHSEELLALEPRPRLVWCQPGASNPEFRCRLESAGILVVEERCLMVEHRKLLGSSSQEQEADR